MTLDEAIKKQINIAKEKFNNANYIMDNMKSDIALENAEDYKRSAEEHRQLAEWLTDYKRLLEQESVIDKIRAEIESITPKAHIRTGKLSIDTELMIPLDRVLKVLDKYKSESEE